ncbi:putative Dol-P-Glc:Glc(2)Man(9)GlcNAc(2)-PP-Dol alpha-1,2-glucosyltransferase [Gigantopelta aegis]|uniref:putative Dol-P-Glc:Glc(2)Man(9)GlcNAc(2)-PP-Dol alpha-1,2-glucosyltransferase n=1 Tax=Gigantopelta aegis TaxID=1735272 RepID=UPI001B88759A|nr:putative Dol-P-Glc:Glc(2)Man(9)GlcNAc(2)-PP-Dol alpha-1,2-glucosyltransferase [Gigantopelta aegis]
MAGSLLVCGVCISAFCLAGLSLLMVINDAQPAPYMDEIFHIPQAQEYCRRNFTSWDPMITTLPGLYLISVGILEPIAKVLQLTTMELCTPLVLRSINLLFMTGNVWLLSRLITVMHFSKKESSTDAITIALTGLTLGSFPVLFFFTGLYYTDPGSVFFVLLMYFTSEDRHHFLAAIYGVLAIFFRQTNIVWLVMVTGIAISESLYDWIQIEKKEQSKENVDDWTVISTFFVLIGRTLKHNPMKLFDLFWKILVKIWSYILVGLGFGVFVFLNGGFVVGDRSQHAACLNIPQIFYFVSVAMFFSCMHILRPHLLIKFIKFCFSNIVMVILFIGLSYLAISHFTYIHEYLLADNRHYPFYVWSKIYKRYENAKYVLIPVYLFGCWSVWDLLRHKNIFWKVSFLVCLLAATVPQKLLEFRYFIIPYIFFRLNMKPSPIIYLVIEFLLYFVVNVATVYLFVKKPFVWSSGELQRFMW